MKVLDLSNNNPEPNWHTLKSHNIGAVWLKATEGVSFNDKPDAYRIDHARRAGLRVGWYHFAEPGRHSAIKEGAHFAEYVKAHGGIQRRDLRPVLDFESLFGLNPSSAFNWIVNFNATVKKSLGVFPAFYSYSSFIEQLHLPRPVGNGLWLAAYSRNDGRPHPTTIPHPWKKWVAHQYSSNCLVPGCSGRVDLSEVTNLRAVLAHPLVGLK